GQCRLQGVDGFEHFKHPNAEFAEFGCCSAEDQPRAFATARCVMTLTKLARYAALAWMSVARSAASILTAAAASGVKLFARACSSPAWRNTPLPPPVTATRTPLSVCATNTPISAKRDAGCLNFM